MHKHKNDSLNNVNKDSFLCLFFIDNEHHVDYNFPVTLLFVI